MIMKTHTLLISLSALIVGVLISCKLVHAQDVSSLFVKFTKVDGHYEYNKDGVPVLGLITNVLSETRVKFTFCSNETIEVERKQLKLSPRKCEQRKNDDIWTTQSKTLVPLIKAKSNGTSAMVTFQGTSIDLTKQQAAANYTEPVLKAKPGDFVGYVFTGEDGRKSAAIFDSPVQ
jgi:hypothetical protein